MSMKAFNVTTLLKAGKNKTKTLPPVPQRTPVLMRENLLLIFIVACQAFIQFALAFSEG